MKAFKIPLIPNLKKSSFLRHFERTKISPGQSPGKLIHKGERHVDQVQIHILDYDADQLETKQTQNPEECFSFREKATVTWINIIGLHDINVIEKIGTHFGIHPLVLEDVLNTDQRPKVEEYEDHIFAVLKMIYYDNTSKIIHSEQLSIVFGKNYVITFQERPGDIFNPIRARLNKSGKLRKSKSDFLAYALLDAVVDNYFIVMESIGEKIEDIEEALAFNLDSKQLHVMHSMKRELIFMRKGIWPIREVINGIARSESRLIKRETKLYLRDVYDHTIQVIDTLETFRDMLSGIHDLYLSNQSNRMNEIMKVLTIFAAIFIPLTLVAGIYGMNFEHIPELTWKYGYAYSLILMGLISVILLGYFKKKKWI